MPPRRLRDASDYVLVSSPGRHGKKVTWNAWIQTMHTIRMSAFFHNIFIFSRAYIYVLARRICVCTHQIWAQRYKKNYIRANLFSIFNGNWTFCLFITKNTPRAEARGVLLTTLRGKHFICSDHWLSYPPHYTTHHCRWCRYDHCRRACAQPSQMHWQHRYLALFLQGWST